MNTEQGTTNYEAWLSDIASCGGASNRIITVAATSHRDAFRQAEQQCKPHEFCRGVYEVEVGA